VKQRSSKCKTKESTIKKYQQEDGSLLTDPPTNGIDEEVELEAEDCEELDATPFDFEYESDTDERHEAERQSLALFLLEDMDPDEHDGPLNTHC
jgi:hypothetical protein